jgi:hypothetical protein
LEPNHKGADGQFITPFAITSDDMGNLLVLDNTSRLQVFDASGTHLCTRSDVGGVGQGIKGIAWSGGQLALANGSSHDTLVWFAKNRSRQAPAVIARE